MERAAIRKLTLTGQTGILAGKIIDRWLLTVPESDPAILTVFRDRDVQPYRELLWWTGEFAGKYLTGCAFLYRMTGREDLRRCAEDFIAQLLQYQDADGYLGCFPKAHRLTGTCAQAPETTGNSWDSWNQYHIMVGLLQWYDLTGNETYFDAVRRMAALFERTFYGENRPITAMGWSEMNLAVYHAFAMLYRRTGEAHYLDFAHAIEADMAAGGDYLRWALEGQEFWQCPKPRWESLHVILGFTELFRATGEEKYRTAAVQIFRSILRTDVHNTGGFSTGEQAVGDPYRAGPIETCCVVAYNALAWEIFRLTGEPDVLDHLEKSHYNAILGAHSLSGRWCTYDTPMRGFRLASHHSIGFQCKPGSPDLNCCSANAPRGVGTLADWALTEQDGLLHLNSYEAGVLETADGLRITVRGDWPAPGAVELDLEGTPRQLALRIPGWSRRTVIWTDGTVHHPAQGCYFRCPVGTAGGYSRIRLEFDFTPRLHPGAGECAGMGCVTAGPVLYGLQCSDCADFARPMPLKAAAGPDAATRENANVPLPDDLPLCTDADCPLPVRQPDGSIALTLCGMTLRDFYHLGQGGEEYTTWLPVAAL